MPTSDEPHAQRGSPLGRAIVTYSRSWHSLAVIRSLGRRGVEVVAGDEYPATPGALSRYAIESFRYPSPGKDPEGFLDALDAIVERMKPGDPSVPYVLLPVHYETFLVARERARFEDRIRVPLADFGAFEIVRHKARLARYADEHGLSVPKSWFPRSSEEVARIAHEVPLPAFVKVPTGASGIGVEEVATEDELVETWCRLAEGRADDLLPFVQEAAPGDDYCVTTLFDRGRLVTAMTYKNVLTFPRGSGPGVVRETVRAAPLEDTAERLLGGLGWHGIAQVDFRWDGSERRGEILEVNPRFFGGLFQAIESGVDYPWLLYRLAVEGHVEAPEHVEIGTRTETPVVGWLATIREIAEREAHLEKLGEAWRDAKTELQRGSTWSAVRTLLSGLRESAAVDGRAESVRQLLDENAQNVGVLLASDDPLPVLGFAYYLAVFLRHGKISHEVVSDAEADAAAAED